MTLNMTAETETARIARGLRERDMELLADLVKHCQHRLVRYLLYLTGKREYAEDYFASSQGRSLLASKGFLSTMPDALWFGLTFGVFTAAFFLALGYIYGDAKRRQMPAWAWVIAAFLIPNLIGFILYFVFRGPLLGPCSSCGKPIRGGEAFCSHCGCLQGSSIGRVTADNRTI